MNIINLMEMLKTQIDLNTFQTIRDDFMESYRAEYKKLRPCKSTADKAIKVYIANAKYRDKKAVSTYSDGATVLMLPDDRHDEKNSMYVTNFGENIIDMLKNKKPVDCYFMDSVALYKTLKKQTNKEYLLHIDGYYYNAELITRMIECIATSKEKYIRAEVCENGALFIQQTYAGMVLPVHCPNGTHPSNNVNMQDFLKYMDSIEKRYIQDVALYA